MEFLLPFPTTAMGGGIIIALLLFLYCVIWMSRVGQGNTRKHRVAPDAAGAWPLIGHLHLLGGPKLPHLTLGAMADKYGPIFSIRVGVHRALIVSSWEMAKECFTTNDKIISTRPKSVAVEHMSDNYAMFGFSPYGPYWRELRRITTLELLSNHRLAMLSHVRESEVQASMKVIYDTWVDKNKSDDSGGNKVLMEMKRWFGGLTLNVIVRIVVGERRPETEAASSESERWRNTLRECLKLLGSFGVSDALPFLRWLDIGGCEKAMKKMAKEMDRVLEGWLKEHKQKKGSGEDKDEQSFMESMLSILDDHAADEERSYDADTINKATCLALILGGNDTTTITLTWALSLLLNNRRALRKVQEELDIHVGRDRQVKESDLTKLVYLQAIIKETLRLYPATQLFPPREFMEDSTVGGYRVPAGTRLFLNLWKMHRDPSVWAPDPSEFRPERFLTTHKGVDVRGQHFELLPFGSGRRVCPGISFALQVVQFTLARLLHGFEVATPSDEPVDMTESFGLTNLKATPLEVLLNPRLSAQLYE